MKAIVFSRYGTPDGLELSEVPRPLPADDELLVRVHACSVNSWDWEFLTGTPFVNRLMFGLFRPRPSKRILGADIAGTVEAVGRNVTRFQPGDAVFGDLWDNWGGFAEFASVPETSLEAKPDNISFTEAAAVPQAGVLALQGLRKGGQLHPGQKVLINGAGGGVGVFAVQLARLAGAEITGVDAAHKLDAVRSAGADHVLDYKQEDFTKTGEQYDLVVDCQNVRSMFDNRLALRAGGTYAMIGGPRVLPLILMNAWSWLTRDDKRYRLVAEGPNKGLSELKELLEAGQLVPLIDRTYPLSKVPEALGFFGEGRHKGKIVITMDDDLGTTGEAA